ncbi:hypothetical protein DMUE_3275 [Dictyocoela muelleri]|nr:hypothetical protein DMUE_3275 [Dictyocoela muelleri]
MDFNMSCVFFFSLDPRLTVGEKCVVFHLKFKKFFTAKMSADLTEKIILSSRGQPKIAYEGHFYNFKESKSDKKICRCNKRGCKAFLKTTLLNELLDISIHNHVKDEVKFCKILLQQEVKKGT